MIAVYSKHNSRLKDLTFNWRDIAERGEPYRRTFDRSNSTRKPIRAYVSESNGIRYPRQILNFPTKCNLLESERTDHPTQKPLGLCGYVIKALSDPSDLVLDSFTGSGSIPVACHRLGRRFIGIERDPVYYEMARQRLINEMSQVNLFAKNETSRAGLNDPGQIKSNVPIITENLL